MYGQEKYGTRLYSVDGIPPEEKEAHFEDLTWMVPEFMARLRELKAVYTSEGFETGYLQQALETVIDQCFVMSAGWGLPRWEKLLGLGVNMELTYEQRREIISAKLRGQGTPTRKIIREAVETICGEDAEVLEENAGGMFVIRFIGVKGIPRNMQSLIGLLEEIKPAHLAYRFEYRYTMWEELGVCTWEELGHMSWADLRIMKEG